MNEILPTAYGLARQYEKRDGISEVIKTCKSFKILIFNIFSIALLSLVQI
jgi:hypothetical protein